jgi:hypothetical protein
MQRFVFNAHACWISLAIGCSDPSARCSEHTETISTNAVVTPGYSAREMLEPILGDWECEFDFKERDQNVARAGALPGTTRGQMQLTCADDEVSHVSFRKVGNNDERLYCGDAFLRVPCTLVVQTENGAFDESYSLFALIDPDKVLLETDVMDWSGSYSFAFQPPVEHEATLMRLLFLRGVTFAQGELIHSASREQASVVFPAAFWSCSRKSSP